jgi:lysozyme
MSKTIEISTKLIQLNEGCKLEVYTCPAGFKTFGYGTNLEVLDADIIQQINNAQLQDAYMLESFAVDLLRREIVNSNKALNTQKWFTDDLSEFQQAIILDLAYNIGVAGVLKFKKMIEAIKQRNYGIAGEEMLLSKYHYQMICYGYKDELTDAEDINTGSALDVISWYNDLDNDNKQLRSTSNALSLQFDKPLGKYKELF